MRLGAAPGNRDMQVGRFTITNRLATVYDGRMTDPGDDMRRDDGGIDTAPSTDDFGSAVRRPGRMRAAGRIVAIVMIALLVALGAIAVAARRRDITAGRRDR